MFKWQQVSDANKSFSQQKEVYLVLSQVCSTHISPTLQWSIIIKVIIIYIFSNSTDATALSSVKWQIWLRTPPPSVEGPVDKLHYAIPELHARNDNVMMTSNSPSSSRMLNEILVLSWLVGWLCGTVVERQYLTSELSLSCARPAADGWPLRRTGEVRWSKTDVLPLCHTTNQPVRQEPEFHWLCSHTSRWMVQHLATCLMTASLSQMSALFISCFHLCGPAHSQRLWWLGLPSRWTQTLEQSAGFTASVWHDSRPVQETAEDSFV